MHALFDLYRKTYGSQLGGSTIPHKEIVRGDIAAMT